MCIALRALEASQRAERSLNGDQAGDHLDGLGRPFVGVRPADRQRLESRQEVV